MTLAVHLKNIIKSKERERSGQCCNMFLIVYLEWLLYKTLGGRMTLRRTNRSRNRTLYALRLYVSAQVPNILSPVSKYYWPLPLPPAPSIFQYDSRSFS